MQCSARLLQSAGGNRAFAAKLALYEWIVDIDKDLIELVLYAAVVSSVAWRPSPSPEPQAAQLS